MLLLGAALLLAGGASPAAAMCGGNVFMTCPSTKSPPPVIAVRDKGERGLRKGRRRR